MECQTLQLEPQPFLEHPEELGTWIVQQAISFQGVGTSESRYRKEIFTREVETRPRKEVVR